MKTLICINTCNRSEYVKAYAYDFILFCLKNDNYDFTVSLDGKDEETIEFCKVYGIPLVYSDKQEGVGISKNRVLKEFSDYDYYFFLEDDVELIDGEIFSKHIDIAQKCKFYHMSLDDRYRFFGNEQKQKCGNEYMLLCDYGSAGFNFFTKKGIEMVGGFHVEFAKYKRFGHTEHTYRFVNKKLHNRAFISIIDCFEGYCVWHNPKSVTDGSKFEQGDNKLAKVEQEFIEQKIEYYPIEVISEYFYNNLTIQDIKIDYLREISKIMKQSIDRSRKLEELKLMTNSSFCMWKLREFYMKIKAKFL